MDNNRCDTSLGLSPNINREQFIKNEQLLRDNKLVMECLKGDMSKFRILIEKHKNTVYAICFNIIKDPQEAENLAQETFIQVYNSLRSYQFKGLKTWISRIAVNKSLDLKKKKLKEKAHQVHFNDEILNLCLDEESPQEKFIKEEDKKKIRRLCGELPKIYSVVIEKYYVGEKSYACIASEENISIKTVESRLYRGKKLLKDMWEEDE